MKYLVSLFFVFTQFKGLAQSINYKYDKVGRLTQAIYPDQKTIVYTYDNNGNRISQITSTIVTAVSNLNDSLIQANNGVFIYPNPSNGNFKNRIYSSQKQQVIVQIHSIDGKLIHTYAIEASKGYYDINININPKPASGTYIVSVKGQTIDASKRIVIAD